MAAKKAQEKLLNSRARRKRAKVPEAKQTSVTVSPSSGQLEVEQTAVPQPAGGSKPLLDEALPVLYQELRRLARDYLAGERPDHTLQPTALVHEAYLRLIQQQRVDWTSREQILGVAARMMRRILVNYAIARKSQKRGAGLLVTTTQPDFADVRALDMQHLDEALKRLEDIDERQSRIVELRFFSGLTIEETARILGISRDTVKREWRTARLWLARELER